MYFYIFCIPKFFNKFWTCKTKAITLMENVSQEKISFREFNYQICYYSMAFDLLFYKLFDLILFISNYISMIMQSLFWSAFCYCNVITMITTKVKVKSKFFLLRRIKECYISSSTSHKLENSETLKLRDFSFFLSSTFIYEPILIKLYINANLMKTHVFYKMRCDHKRSS